MADRYFTYEIQHLFPTAIFSEDTLDADAAESLLRELGFDLESIGNKMPLLTKDETIAVDNSGDTIPISGCPMP